MSASGRSARTSTSNDLATHWELIDAGDGNFRLRNVDNGRYLDGDSGDIDTTSNASANGTVWQFIEYGDGQYYVYNIRYDDYVDANGTNTRVDWDPGLLDPDDRWIVSLV